MGYAKKDLKSECNSAVVRKLRKNMLACCGFCPWHRGENFRNHGFDNRNWKNYRDHQWKDKPI